VIPVVCNDNNLCTNDTCSPNGEVAQCIFTPISCLTSDPCYPASCNLATGTCQTQAVVCDDHNLCTTKQCVAVNDIATCVFQNKPCTTDMCHTASCHAAVGTCDIASNPPCNDNNACTMDSCDTILGCTYTQISCDDSNACTTDTCDSVLGCVHTQISCDDHNVCTSDHCFPDHGCNYTDIPVPSGNFCEGVYCDKVVGIVRTPTSCPSACSGCDRDLGCQACPGGGLTTAEEAATIGAGAIAGIVLASISGAAIFSFAGKKGYDRLMRSRTTVTAIVENPFYEAKATEIDNPLFEN